MKILAYVSAMLLAGTCAAPAIAQESHDRDGFVRAGVARIKLVDEGKIFVNGTRDPEAGYETPEKYVGSVQLGYFLADNFAVELAGTTPATTQNIPAGSLAGLPNLGNDTFSIFTLTGTFHPLRGNTLSPYIGAGVGLQKVWSTEDRLATNMKVNDAFGAVLQAGVELAVSDRFGVYFEAKKGFWDANASGDLGPAHITAVAKLDPLILTAGGFLRF